MTQNLHIIAKRVMEIYNNGYHSDLITKIQFIISIMQLNLMMRRRVILRFWLICDAPFPKALNCGRFFAHNKLSNQFNRPLQNNTFSSEADKLHHINIGLHG